MEQYSYEQGRELIKDGDIIFVRNSPTLTSKIIRFFTNSPYSHVGIAFWATIGGQQRLLVVEAQGGTKRRVVNMGFYSLLNVDVASSPRDWNEYAVDALESIGIQDYGWFEAGYVGLREVLLHYFNWALSSRDLPGEICSEFVARLLQLPDPHISPQGLARTLDEIGHPVKFQITPRNRKALFRGLFMRNNNRLD